MILLFSKLVQHLAQKPPFLKLYLIIKFFLTNWELPFMKKGSQKIEAHVDEKFQSEVISYDYNRSDDVFVALY